MRVEYYRKIIKSGPYIESYIYKNKNTMNYKKGSASVLMDNMTAEAYRSKLKELNEEKKNDESYKIRYEKNNCNRAMENLKRIFFCNYTKNSSFLTLTFDKGQEDERFNRRYEFEVDELKDVSYCMGFIKLFFKRLNHHLKKQGLRKKNLKYLCVPEEHKDGSYHFHICLFSVCKIDMELLVSSWGYGSLDIKQIKSDKGLYNYISKDLIGYVSKNLKDVNLNKKAYTTSRNLSKPIVYISPEDENFNFEKKSATCKTIVCKRQFNDVVNLVDGKLIKVSDDKQYIFKTSFYGAEFQWRTSKVDSCGNSVHMYDVDIVKKEKYNEVYKRELIRPILSAKSENGTENVFVNCIKWSDVIDDKVINESEPIRVGSFEIDRMVA